jgi:hypothetical protein
VNCLAVFLLGLQQVQSRPNFSSAASMLSPKATQRGFSERGALSISGMTRESRYAAQKPTGLLFYHGAGNMAVQIMPDWDRPKFALGKATPEQAKAAIDAYSAYFGTYSVDEQTSTVTHHRTGNINPGDMADFVRQVEFQEPNRLILKTRGTNNQIVWERVGK